MYSSPPRTYNIHQTTWAPSIGEPLLKRACPGIAPSPREGNDVQNPQSVAGISVPDYFVVRPTNPVLRENNRHPPILTRYETPGYISAHADPRAAMMKEVWKLKLVHGIDVSPTPDLLQQISKKSP
uniref:DET1- and DDB1-associated protein 1 n=1 Tax=Steinernema glaseri TaxID=37863 RepID=A0A1I7Y5Z6_9BILA